MSNKYPTKYIYYIYIIYIIYYNILLYNIYYVLYIMYCVLCVIYNIYYIIIKIKNKRSKIKILNGILVGYTSIMVYSYLPPNIGTDLEKCFSKCSMYKKL